MSISGPKNGKIQSKIGTPKIDTPKIDTPKIDTFYEKSGNFENSKILGEVLSKSHILGQNHK